MEGSSKETQISFKKVDRSHRTPPGWRLATFREARDNLESVTAEGLLRDWDRARLLDGWIVGPCFDFNSPIGNDFKGCMGYMLITQPNSISDDSGKHLYEDVTLGIEEMLVALQLSAEDFNHEVVYWVLNSLAKTETMDPVDVRDGRVPIGNASIVDEMKKLNLMLNDLARQLWDAPFSKDEGSRKLDPRSVEDTFAKIRESCWNKFTEDRKKVLSRSFEMVVRHSTSNFDEIPVDGTWNVVSAWQYVSFSVFKSCRYYGLGTLMNNWLNDKNRQVTRSERNFILSISFIYYYYNFLADYEFTKSYTILDMVLDVAASLGDVLVMSKMLDCGACLRIGNSTVLHTALEADVSEDKMLEMLRICLDKCKLRGEANLVNEADPEGMTALHSASLKGKARSCELLLQRGAKPDLTDMTGRLPLHYAVEKRNDQVIDMLTGEGISELFSSKSSDGQSILDIAVAQNNTKLITKLLPILEQTAESYIDKVDRSKLLREFALQGSADIVRKLLERGANPLDVDEEGKTALHYAAMGRDIYSAQKTSQLIIDNCIDAKTLKAKVGKDGSPSCGFE